MSTPKPIDERRGHTSASNALADSLCEGRHQAQAGLPDEPGPYAESGRKVHAALAQNNERPFDMGSLTLAERETFDACREIEKKLVLQYFGENHPPMRVFREERYWAKIKHGERLLEHSGQPDVVFRAGTKALICEYKTLAGDVPVSPKNLQLRDQAVLVRGNFVPTDEIAVAVIQPMVTRTPTLCVYSKDDLDTAAKEMIARVKASNTPGAKRTAGEVQCKYCKARKTCIVYQQFAGQITPPAMLSILSVPMASWTREQLGVFCNGLGPAQKFLDEGKEFVKAALERDPNAVDGWTLEPGAVREKIVNPQEVFNRFVTLGGKVEQFMPCVDVRKGALKEALNVVTGAKGKPLEAAVKTLTDGCVEAKQTAPSLKRVEKGAA